MPTTAISKKYKNTQSYLHIWTFCQILWGLERK